jgi:hypothetical protein
MDAAKLFVLVLTVLAISVLAYLELKSRSNQQLQNPPEEKATRR